MRAPGFEFLETGARSFQLVFAVLLFIAQAGQLLVATLEPGDFQHLRQHRVPLDLLVQQMGRMGGRPQAGEIGQLRIDRQSFLF